jgi:hypothetical protein
MSIYERPQVRVVELSTHVLSSEMDLREDNCTSLKMKQCMWLALLPLNVKEGQYGQ